ncbi:undecaprenyldiphospho-muramoylpentapeptide beta-N-acetylglucosaminyltransferase [Neolewinella persica]|uniref:undecaprenyldiphospho-muramoylpentapeptide beta-N-acetylglucosaminyltransferase n=1 Tax=Neolewinella persica TaxID=70998 RepID=UPI00039C25FD|nr:undecaprenyldiphospho-muramoylpentapeptide beta-N-acetylglucosaminyltransferase [Neolewinella persica]
MRIIVSGGGTGGHIYPAIAIADELKRLRPDTRFLFVGAAGRMEMEKVPKAGYEIKGLWISGLQRKLTLDNLSFPFKVIHSLWTSRKIIKAFKPDVVVGTGGYAGGPVLYAAAKMGVPTLIQEPNAFAGLANKWLGKHMDKICVAFPGMEKFFPKEALVETGNPVREEMLERVRSSAEAALAPDSSANLGVNRSADESALSSRLGRRANILLMGGSGGARSMNEALRDSTRILGARPQVQWTWQCGTAYYEAFKDCASAQLPNVTISAFIDDMEQAYAKADVVIGRAGSTTIAEIQFLGKPTILVPSPWVAEDHQTMNARALTERDAAVLVADKDLTEKLVPTVYELLDDEARRKELGQNARAMAQTGAVTRIANEVLNLISSSQKSAN